MKEKRTIGVTTAGITISLVSLLMALLTVRFGSSAVLFSAVPLAFAIVGVVATLISLRRMHVDVVAPAAVAHGEEFAIVVRLWTESLRIVPRDVVVEVAFGETFRRIGVIGSFDSRGEALIRGATRVFTRGRYRSVRVRLVTSFPFGLIERHVVIQEATDVTVHPAVHRLRGWTAENGRGSIVHRHGGSVAGEEDLRGLHDWRPGESARRIHWKVSARRGRRVVRVLDEPRRPPVCIVFRAWTRAGAARPSADFELAVRLAASLVTHFVRAGREWRFVLLQCDGVESVRVLELRRRADVLSRLAEIECRERASADSIVAPAGRRGEETILVTCTGERRRDDVHAHFDVRTRATRRWLRNRAWNVDEGAASSASTRGVVTRPHGSVARALLKGQ